MPDIIYHLKQIDESGEVHLSDAIKKFLIPSDKWDEQGVLLYNLDAIIAVGYRVNSYEATQFRGFSGYGRGQSATSHHYENDRLENSVGAIFTDI